MNVTLDVWAVVEGLPTFIDQSGDIDDLRKIVDHALDYGDVVEVTVRRVAS